MVYEDDADRLAEGKFLQRIKDRFHCKAIKFPYSWKLDYILTRKDEPSAFAELKVREIPVKAYSTTVISEDKVKMGIWYATHMGRLDGGVIPFILFIRFSDGDFWVKIDKELLTRCEVKMLDASNCSSTCKRKVRPHVFIQITELKEF